MEQEFLSRYGIGAVLLYIVLRDGLPAIYKLIQRFIEVYIPAKSHERELEMKQSDERVDRRIDLKEREVAALEAIGKGQVLLDARMKTMEGKLDLVTTSLITANQALAVIMDRTTRHREDFQNNMAPE